MILKNRMTSAIRFLLMLFVLGSAVEMFHSSQAEARAGRGRSMGRSSGFGGNRSTPAQRPPQQSRPQDNVAPGAAPAAPAGGGFMRGLAGGLAGGLLGGMLFSSLGHAAGLGGGAGGIGFLEIILFAAVAYFGFRWWKNRQLRPASATAMGYSNMNRQYSSSVAQDQIAPVGFGSPSLHQNDRIESLGTPTLSPDEASDIFFKIQGAWTRRDLSTVSDRMESGIYDELARDAEHLKRNRQINRLENISVRHIEVTREWQEGGDTLATVVFTANLLDYTVDESTQKVVEGSDTQPVKFQEEWTFIKPQYADQWRLAGIQQMN